MCLKLILDFANVTRAHVKSKDLLPKKKKLWVLFAEVSYNG